MDIKNISIATDNQTLTPSLQITLALEYNPGKEIPVSVTGRLLSSENKVISNLTDNYLAGDSKAFDMLQLPQQKNPTKQHLWYFHLTAPFSHIAIEHIENLRGTNEERSVTFNFDLVVKYFKLPEQGLVLNASSTKTVMRFQIERIKTSNTILQGDWIKRFAPYFGIGKFMLLELKIPEGILVDEFWKKLYDRVVQNLQEMEKGLKNGDWQKVMTTSRKFYENIKFGDKKLIHTKFREQFDVIMKNEGHTDEGIQNLYDAIKNLFSFTSKYVHDKDNDGNINPIVICTKEDAYLVYSLSVGLLSLIGKKISK